MSTAFKLKIRKVVNDGDGFNQVARECSDAPHSGAQLLPIELARRSDGAVRTMMERVKWRCMYVSFSERHTTAHKGCSNVKRYNTTNGNTCGKLAVKQQFDGAVSDNGQRVSHLDCIRL